MTMKSVLTYIEHGADDFLIFLVALGTAVANRNSVVVEVFNKIEGSI